jgi:uncharacterized protein
MPIKKKGRRPQPESAGGRPKRRTPKISLKKQLVSALIGLSMLVMVVVFAGYLFQRYTSETPKPPEAPEEVSKKPTPPPMKFEIYPKDIQTKPEKPALRPPSVTAPGDLPRVCIIIDDMGYDRKLAEKFLGLEVPVTFSMLPFSPFQEAITKAAGNKHVEIMLHLPMEPDEYPRVDPGPGALLTSMSSDELIRQLTRDIRSVPGIKGVNNHMGSKMTAVSSQMYQIFTILKKEGLFFIDSRTSASTLSKPSARLLQVPFAERDIFLDHVTTAEFVRKQLGELILRAQQDGMAIGIGHPHPITYQVLKEMLPELKKKVRLVPASQLVALLG